MSLAATALFMAGVINGESVTQDKIAKASGISAVTIRNVTKVFKNAMDLETK